MAKTLTLTLLPDRLAVCRLDPGSAIPDWGARGAFFSLTRTTDELSIVCREEDAPSEVRSEKGWRAFKIEGPLDFNEIGVLASVAQPLTQASVSLFVISTFDTDTILVKESQLQTAIMAFSRAGHQVKNVNDSLVVRLGWRLPNNTRFNVSYHASVAAYDDQQDRWLVVFENLLSMTDGMPQNVNELVRNLKGKWAYVPNEARLGMTLPLKFETLTGKIKYFHESDPRVKQ
jgi:hypothetical protein